jgi:hypothetical protein
MAMTAILNIDVLRAHAVPAITETGCGNPAAPVRNRLFPRPVLVARWRVRPDGHLVCRWETENSNGFGLSPG